MKLQLIEKISRQAVALVLLAGICLLYNKGIVPVYTIVLFLFSGTIIGFFFRALSFVIKIILVLLLAGMFVSPLILQRHENSSIFFPGSGHAGRMARHTPYQTD